MLGFGFTGCTVGPDYQSPEITAAPRRTPLKTVDVPSRTVEGKIDSAWWKSFRDSKLSSLVERLVAQNLDLKTTAERVIQSVAQRQVAASQGQPHIEGQSLTTYNRQSPNGPLSLLTPAPGASLDYALFRDGLTSSWQLDLFGRVRRAVEAADANALAAVENRHGIALAAVAELAQSYMQLRGTQNRLEIAKRNLRLAEQNVDLVNERFGGGVATTLDLASSSSAGFHRRNPAAAADPGGGAHQRHRAAVGRCSPRARGRVAPLSDTAARAAQGSGGPARNARTPPARRTRG
jgi:outer membrane protein TolC